MNRQRARCVPGDKDCEEIVPRRQARYVGPTGVVERDDICEYDHTLSGHANIRTRDRCAVRGIDNTKTDALVRLELEIGALFALLHGDRSRLLLIARPGRAHIVGPGIEVGQRVVPP